MLRIFSKNNDISSNNYLKNKKNKVILTNLKTNNNNTNNVSINNNKIVSFLSYNDFLNITQTFYKFSNLNKNYKAPQKIIDLKTSFIFYNKFLNHIQNCEFCNNNNYNNCKEVKNILYPYGEYFTYEIYSNLAKVDLNCWCNQNLITDTFSSPSESLTPNILGSEKLSTESLSTSDINFYDQLTSSKKVFDIFIAEVTNSREYTYNNSNENNFYNVYNFIPIFLKFDEFKNIFFNSNTSYFNISDTIYDKTILSNQVYKNRNNSIETFVITNSIKKIYIEKNNYNNMDANTLIEIEKETKDYISLYDFNYITNSLNLNDIYYIIKENNINDDYYIKIKIKVYYISKKTDIPCIMYFNYIIEDFNLDPVLL
jgi:hypothetical protein